MPQPFLCFFVFFIGFFTNSGKRCEKSDAQTVEVTIVNGGKVLTGHGCPEHEMLPGFASATVGKDLCLVLYSICCFHSLHYVLVLPFCLFFFNFIFFCISMFVHFFCIFVFPFLFQFSYPFFASSGLFWISRINPEAINTSASNDQLLTVKSTLSSLSSVGSGPKKSLEKPGSHRWEVPN